METKIVKHGIGIFTREPVLPETLAHDVDPRAPEGVAVMHGDEAAVINVPAGFASDEPIRLRASGRAKIVLLIGDGASVRVVEEAADAERDLSVDLHVGDGASVRYHAVQDGARTDFARRRAWVGRNARLEWKEILLGGTFRRASTETRLIGEGAGTHVSGIFIGGAAEEFDVLHEVMHEAPRTASRISTRVALAGSAKTVYRDMIRIPKGMHGCDGRQETHGLLLSPRAEFDPVPQLEVGTDDVACAHAASVGRLDDEKLFYLMSRGLGRDAATRAYVEGFLGIEDEEVASAAMKILHL